VSIGTLATTYFGASAATAATVGTIGATVGTAAVTAGVGAALAPDAPKDKPGPAMPDPVAQEAARRRAIAEQLGRRGRASTFLSENASGKLGG
jgi:hypothetical protein